MRFIPLCRVTSGGQILKSSQVFRKLLLVMTKLILFSLHNFAEKDSNYVFFVLKMVTEVSSTI